MNIPRWGKYRCSPSAYVSTSQGVYRWGKGENGTMHESQTKSQRLGKVIGGERKTSGTIVFLAAQLTKWDNTKKRRHRRCTALQENSYSQAGIPSPRVRLNGISAVLRCSGQNRSIKSVSHQLGHIRLFMVKSIRSDSQTERRGSALTAVQLQIEQGHLCIGFQQLHSLFSEGGARPREPPPGCAAAAAVAAAAVGRCPPPQSRGGENWQTQVPRIHFSLPFPFTCTQQWTFTLSASGPVCPCRRSAHNPSRHSPHPSEKSSQAATAACRPARPARPARRSHLQAGVQHAAIQLPVLEGGKENEGVAGAWLHCDPAQQRVEKLGAALRGIGAARHGPEVCSRMQLLLLRGLASHGG